MRGTYFHKKVDEFAVAWFRFIVLFHVEWCWSFWLDDVCCWKILLFPKPIWLNHYQYKTPVKLSTHTIIMCYFELNGLLIFLIAYPSGNNFAKTGVFKADSKILLNLVWPCWTLIFYGFFYKSSESSTIFPRKI